MKIIGKLFYTLVILILVIVAGTVALAAANTPWGIHLFTVQSGSMEPALHVGSVVIVRAQDNYQVGDIVTFKSFQEKDNPRPKLTTTHRITEVQSTQEGIFYSTKGDANDVPDGNQTEKGLVIGRVLFTIPLLGYPIAYSRTQAGLIFLIIIPATLIVYTELVSIKNEARRLLIQRKKRKLTMFEKAEVAIGSEEIKIEESIKEFVDSTRTT